MVAAANSQGPATALVLAHLDGILLHRQSLHRLPELWVPVRME